MRKRWYIALSFMERDNFNPSKPPVTIAARLLVRGQTFEATQQQYEAALKILREAGFTLDSKGDVS